MLRPLVLLVLFSCYFAPATGAKNVPILHIFDEIEDESYTYEPPTLVAPIEDIEQRLTAGPIRIDLTKVFSDPEGRPLAYTTRPREIEIATLTVENDTLEIVPRAIGTVEIRVVAIDVDDARTRDFFNLTFRANAPPYLSSQGKLQDQELTLGQNPYSVSLRGVFVDPDEDGLVYTVTSSNPEVTVPFIAGEILTVPTSSAGDAVITIKADDEHGGQTETSFRVSVINVYPSQLLVQIDKPFEDPERQTSYRMVALPGRQNLMIDEVAEGIAHEDWIAYAADTSSGGQLLLYDGSENFAFRPGRGMWFLHTKTWRLNYRSIPTVPLSADGTYKIPLHEGWNIISNPFEVNIPWRLMESYNNITQGLWQWDGSYSRSDTFRTSLKQAEAFYFKNTEELDSLVLPHPFFATNGSAGKTTPVKTEFIELTAQSVSQHSASVSVGFSPDSRSGFDSYDLYAPPGHFATLEFFLSNEHADFGGQPLARDYRNSYGELTRYDLILADTESRFVRLFAEGLEDVAAEAVVLINLENTRRYDLDERNPVSIQINGEKERLALLVGRRDEIDTYIQQLKPAMTALFPNYPNPFTSQTTFEFATETSETVNLSVFDSMGRRIVTLFDGIKEAGLHQLTWHGYDQARKRVANGVYFYRLRAGAFEETKKLILLR